MSEESSASWIKSEETREESRNCIEPRTHHFESWFRHSAAWLGVRRDDAADESCWMVEKLRRMFDHGRAHRPL